MRSPSLAHAGLALATVPMLALGACSQSGAGAPAAPPSRATHASAAPSSGASTTSGPPHLARVRPAGFRLPTAIGREAVITTGCTAVVAGGLDGGDSSVATAYRLDLRQGRVNGLPSLPVPVHDTAGVLNGRPLVIGGGNAAEQSAVQAWDGSRWHVVGHLRQARSDLVAASVAGHVIVMGGYDGTRPAEPYILSSTDARTWNVIGVLPVPVRYPASTVADGAIWLFGGESAHVTKSAIQRIDPATGRARVVGRLPRPSGHAVAIPLGRRILIAGGRTADGTVTDRMWWFDPRTGAVTGAGHLPHPLSDSAVAQCQGSYYLVGGESPAITDQVLRVDYQ